MFPDHIVDFVLTLRQNLPRRNQHDRHHDLADAGPKMHDAGMVRSSDNRLVKTEILIGEFYDVPVFAGQDHFIDDLR
ncbi:hypothetical protein D3C73_1273210 [compost metagenome]